MVAVGDEGHDPSVHAAKNTKNAPNYVTSAANFTAFAVNSVVFAVNFDGIGPKYGAFAGNFAIFAANPAAFRSNLSVGICRLRVDAAAVRCTINVMNKYPIIIAVLCCCVCFSATSPAQDRLSKYRKVSAYEIRNRIWAIPRLSASGELCEIGLQRLSYSPEIVAVSPVLSESEILEVLDELVPPSERGLPGNYLRNFITIDGGVIFKRIEYERVSVKIFQAFDSKAFKSNAKERKSNTDPVAATITWNDRPCPTP